MVKKTGGLRNIFDFLFINPIKQGIKNELEMAEEKQRGRRRGGIKVANPTEAQLKKVEELRAKMATNVKPKKTQEQLDELKQKRLEIAIWKKSREGKSKLGEINELTPDEKLAYAKQQSRKGKQSYDEQMEKYKEQQKVEQERKEAKQERDWAEEERLRAWNEREEKRLANQSGDIWDTITKGAIDLTGKIPGVGAVMKPVLTETYKGLKGLGMSKQPRHFVGMSEQPSHKVVIGRGMSKQKQKVGFSLKKTREQPLRNEHPELDNNVNLGNFMMNNIFDYQKRMIRDGVRQEFMYR
jgi:hypothetical protein